MMLTLDHAPICAARAAFLRVAILDISAKAEIIPPCPLPDGAVLVPLQRAPAALQRDMGNIAAPGENSTPRTLL
jgi:hypothetical protein